jgi:hypothetical protein
MRGLHIRRASVLFSSHPQLDRAVDCPLLGFVVGTVMWLVFSAIFALVLDEGISGVRLALTDPSTLRGVIWPGGIIGAIIGVILWLFARPDQQTS